MDQGAAYTDRGLVNEWEIRRMHKGFDVSNCADSSLVIHSSLAQESEKASSGSEMWTLFLNCIQQDQIAIIAYFFFFLFLL